MPEASLMDVLEAREQRVQAQQEMLRAHGKPVISFTLNIAGPIKVDPLTQYAFSEGKDAILAGLNSMRIPVMDEILLDSVAGSTLLLAVDGDAEAVKRLGVLLEESDRMGRLYDIDVLSADGEKLSRPKERCCIVCGKEGRECASRRLHPLVQIQEATRGRILSHYLERESERTAALAVQSLLDEVCATPKPGLVDRSNCGSHRDMDIFTFCASAAALESYFRRCFLTGAEDRCRSAEETFSHLQGLGLEAERVMLRVTGGVNTHKGAIYSLGLLCGAAGRTLPEEPGGTPVQPETLLEVCGTLAAARRFGDVGDTHGARAKRQYGAGGVQAEAAAGFPTVAEVGLPALHRAQEAGLDLNDRCVYVLLHLIARVQDTNMIARGGAEKADWARQAAKALLEDGSLPGREAVQALDDAFIQENLSPGGCADLLAATLFLGNL